jgi:hypothetical protein
MLMRYRGGGIGHKYMRDIETKYENMSRLCLHGKKPCHKPGPTQANDQGVDSASDSNDEKEDSGPPPADKTTEPMAGSLGKVGDLDESDDEDYAPSETGSSDGGGIDSDEITSDFDYGLADP